MGIFSRRPRSRATADSGMPVQRAPEPPAPPDPGPPSPRAWASVPPIRLRAARSPEVLATDFSGGLSTWQNPSFSGPLNHVVRSEAPFGIITASLSRAAAPRTLPGPATLLPVARPPGFEPEPEQAPAERPPQAPEPAQPPVQRSPRLPAPGRFTSAARQPAQRRLAPVQRRPAAPASVTPEPRDAAATRPARRDEPPTRDANASGVSAETRREPERERSVPRPEPLARPEPARPEPVQRRTAAPEVNGPPIRAVARRARSGAAAVPPPTGDLPVRSAGETPARPEVSATPAEPLAGQAGPGVPGQPASQPTPIQRVSARRRTPASPAEDPSGEASRPETTGAAAHPPTMPAAAAPVPVSPAPPGPDPVWPAAVKPQIAGTPSGDSRHAGRPEFPVVKAPGPANPASADPPSTVQARTERPQPTRPSAAGRPVQRANAPAAADAKPPGTASRKTVSPGTPSPGTAPPGSTIPGVGSPDRRLVQPPIQRVRSRRGAGQADGGPEAASSPVAPASQAPASPVQTSRPAHRPSKSGGAGAGPDASAPVTGFGGRTSAVTNGAGTTTLTGTGTTSAAVPVSTPASSGTTSRGGAGSTAGTRTAPLVGARIMRSVLGGGTGSARSAGGAGALGPSRLLPGSRAANGVNRGGFTSQRGISRDVVPAGAGAAAPAGAGTRAGADTGALGGAESRAQGGPRRLAVVQRAAAPPAPSPLEPVRLWPTTPGPAAGGRLSGDGGETLGAGGEAKTRSADRFSDLPVLPRGPSAGSSRVVTQRAAAGPSRGGPEPASQPGSSSAPVSRSAVAAPKTQAARRPDPPRAAVQRAAASASPVPAPAPAPATGKGDVDIDEIVSLVTRRLRTEFRLDRERFGRLRDSTR